MHCHFNEKALKQKIRAEAQTMALVSIKTKLPNRGLGHLRVVLDSDGGTDSAKISGPEEDVTRAEALISSDFTLYPEVPPVYQQVPPHLPKFEGRVDGLQCGLMRSIPFGL